jgi:hypothetical protein
MQRSRNRLSLSHCRSVCLTCWRPANFLLPAGLRMQAPPSIPKPHIDDNRQITCSIQPQSSVPRVPSNKPTGNPISMPLVETSIEPTGKPACAPGIKPTTLPDNFSKHKHFCKWQATQLCKAATPTSPTPCIKTQAQVATAATRVIPPSSNTRSQTQHSGTPLPTHWPGFAASVMRQQQRQHGLVCLTQCIT